MALCVTTDRLWFEHNIIDVTSMISSQPISCHVLHCCCIIGILYWLDLTNSDSRPGERVNRTCVLITVSLFLTTVLSVLLAVKRHEEREGVRRKSGKNRIAVGTENQFQSHGSGGECVSESGSVIELWRRRGKLRQPVKQLLVTIISFAIVLHVAIVLLGAPFTRLADRTASLSLIISILTVVPVFVQRCDANVSFCSQFTGLFMNKNNAKTEGNHFDRFHLLSVIFAAWFACLTTKLDWNEVWQEFPVPSVCGALTGSLFAHTFHLTTLLLQSSNY